MSRRECVHVSRKLRFESPPSPNSTVDLITVEIRVFYPPNADQMRLQNELGEAYLKASNELSERF